MKTRLLRVATAATLATTTACFDLSGLGGISFEDGFCCAFIPTAFDIAPTGDVRILADDTVRFRVRSDSGHHLARWTTTGVFRIVEGGTLVTTSSAADSVVFVTATDTGAGEVRASSWNSGHKVAFLTRAIDSSAVRRITMNHSGTSVVARRDSVVLMPDAYDAMHFRVEGQPKAIWVSDTTRGRISRHTVSWFGSTHIQLYFVPRDTGRVVVYAGFGTLRDSAVMNVIP